MGQWRKKRNILFICTHNSARSQIAEGIINKLYGDRYEAFSAGIDPSEVNSIAIQVMSEIGIDISGHYSKSIEQFVEQEFDYVITVCDHAKETCPFFPGGKERIHKGFADPAAIDGTAEEKMAGFRRIRDEIKQWIDEKFGASAETDDSLK
jgi:arsenate reductase